MELVDLGCSNGDLQIDLIQSSFVAHSGISNIVAILVKLPLPRHCVFICTSSIERSGQRVRLILITRLVAVKRLNSSNQLIPSSPISGIQFPLNVRIVLNIISTVASSRVNLKGVSHFRSIVPSAPP